MTHSQIFTLINGLGGAAVIGSYAVVLIAYPETKEYLWGGIGGVWRSIFTGSMIVAGSGYLMFVSMVLFGSGAEFFDRGNIMGTHTLSFLCAIFLGSATVWMPSTVAYINTQLLVWWIVAVSVLWITALSLIAMGIVVATTSADETNLCKFLALSGLLYISFHCLVLDAVVWVSKFPKTH